MLHRGWVTVPWQCRSLAVISRTAWCLASCLVWIYPFSAFLFLTIVSQPPTPQKDLFLLCNSTGVRSYHKDSESPHSVLKFFLSTGCMECCEPVLPVPTLGSSNTGSPGHWVAGSDEMLTQKSFLFLFYISNQDSVATEWFKKIFYCSSFPGHFSYHLGSVWCFSGICPLPSHLWNTKQYPECEVIKQKTLGQLIYDPSRHLCTVNPTEVTLAVFENENIFL